MLTTLWRPITYASKSEYQMYPKLGARRKTKSPFAPPKGRPAEKRSSFVRGRAPLSRLLRASSTALAADGEQAARQVCRVLFASGLTAHADNLRPRVIGTALAAGRIARTLQLQLGIRNGVACYRRDDRAAHAANPIPINDLRRAIRIPNVPKTARASSGFGGYHEREPEPDDEQPDDLDQ